MRSLQTKTPQKLIKYNIFYQLNFQLICQSDNFRNFLAPIFKDVFLLRTDDRTQDWNSRPGANIIKLFTTVICKRAE